MKISVFSSGYFTNFKYILYSENNSFINKFFTVTPHVRIDRVSNLLGYRSHSISTLKIIICKISYLNITYLYIAVIRTHNSVKFFFSLRQNLKKV